MKSIGSMAHTSALKHDKASQRAIKAIIVAGCCLSLGFVNIVKAKMDDESIDIIAKPACVPRAVVL
jgi:hypothetical protein